MHFACYCDPEFPIEPILQELKEKGIGFELRESEGQRSLWLADAEYVVPVTQAYDVYKQRVQQQKQHTLTIKNLKQLPITTALIVLSLFVALLTQLGEQNLDAFYIAQIQYYPRGWVPYSGVEAVWHSVSPIFLHFGVEHLVFNCLSCWYLGSILERKLSKFAFMCIAIMIAVISNYTQLWVSGPLFGGLSGVVYGFIGFAFVYQLFRATLGIPKGLFYLAIGWLLLGYTPIFEAVGLGSMANAAHLSGLLAGGVLFFIWSIFSKKESV